MKSVKDRMKDASTWYNDGASYWESVDPTVEGMLQGYEHISDIDVQGSLKFLNELKEDKLLTSRCVRAADCGAGIGRVSKHFLLNHFDLVDIVEPCEKFTDNIHKYMNDEYLSSKIEHIFNQGLQNFVPQENHYDVIWIQWVIGQLTDDDLVDFLKRCVRGLTQGGCIVIKDNVTAGRMPIFHSSDSSVTRMDDQLLALFERAGLHVTKSSTQERFPLVLFPVKMFALR